MGIARGILEHVFFGIEARASDVLAFVPFYLSLPFVYGFFLSLLGLAYEKILQAVTFATLLGLLPPIIDFLLGTDKTHSVFYGYFVTRDWENFPWLGYNPAKNYPLGEAITIWLSFFLVFTYVYYIKKNIGKAFLSLFLGYLAYLTYSLALPASGMLLLFGEIPTPEGFSSYSFSQKRQIVYAIALMQVFLSWFVDAHMTKSLKNYLRRLFHVAPFLLATWAGLRQSMAMFPHYLMALGVTLSAALVAIAHNDFQCKVDPQKHPSLYRHGLVANFFAVAIILMILFAGYKFALLGLASWSLSVLYHYPFYEARNTAYGSMKIEGLWGMFSYLTGAMAGQIDFPHKETVIYSLVLFGGFSFFSVAKDAKDIRQDFHEKRVTFYTYLYKKGVRLRLFQRLYAVTSFIFLIIAGYLYYSDAFSLVTHAILSAIAAYFLLNSAKAKWFYAFLSTLSVILVLFSI